MEFKEAIKILDSLLSKKDPSTFNSSWVLKTHPKFIALFGKIFEHRINILIGIELSELLITDFGKDGNILEKDPNSIGIKKKFTRY